MLGLETNGIFLEQAEELSEKTYEMAMSRIGSWYLPKMPRGLLFMTFNPTQRWVKKMIYTPWVEGTLPAYYYFMGALPTDNPFVTQNQLDIWAGLAERYQKQFIEGDRSDYDSENNRLLFAFSEKKSVGKVEWNPREMTYLSFDFNWNPIVCSVWQIINGVIYGVRVIKLYDATIYRLCEEIDRCFSGGMFFVTGDYSGGTLTTMSSVSNFDVIKSYFGLSKSQMQVSVNPRLEDSRMLCNSVLERTPMVVDEENCRDFIFDAKNSKANPDNTIVKNNRKDEAQQADTLDTFRYFVHRWFRDMMRILAKS